MTEVPPGEAQSSEQPPWAPAGSWRRLMGIIYESILLFAVLFFFGYAFSALAQFKGGPGLTRTLLQGWLFLVLGAYFTYFWSNGRRSLPMKTLNLSLRTAGSHAPVSIGRAFLRYCVALSILFLPLALAKAFHPLLALLSLAGYAASLVDRRSRALYDRWCGTELLFVPDPPAVGRGEAVAEPDQARLSRTQSTK